MKDLITLLDARKKELASYQTLRVEDAERLWEKFRLEWNYNSNHIEGNTLTYLETKALLIRELLPTGNHPAREVDEMRAHDFAVQTVREWAEDAQRELLEADIRDLNRIILVKPFWKEAITPDGQSVRRLIKIGEYKEFPNHVLLQNGQLFKYAEPNEVAQRMDALMSWYRYASQTLHPAMVAAKLHYDFVCIHPFDDGNGRVSRLLMNYHLLRCNFQPVIIKSEDKRNYFAALQRADVGDFEAFARYIAEQMIWSLDLSIRAAKGESVEEEGDWEKKVELLKRTVESQMEKKAHEKDDYKALIATWLQTNIPSLISEMEKWIGPFEKFFRVSQFHIRTQIHPTNQPLAINMPYHWQEVAKGIVEEKTHSRIVLIYDFSEPISIEAGIKPFSCAIDVSFTENGITISNYQNKNLKIEVPFGSVLKNSDFLPITELAKTIFQEIQSVTGKA